MIDLLEYEMAGGGATEILGGGPTDPENPVGIARGLEPHLPFRSTTSAKSNLLSHSRLSLCQVDEQILGWADSVWQVKICIDVSVLLSLV
jgi:hypothetical protein